MTEGKVVLLAVGLDLGQLLFGGLVLTVTARVADVGIYDGGGRDGGGRRDVGQFTISDLRLAISGQQSA